MSLSSQPTTNNERRIFFVLPEQMQLVKHLITLEVSSDCEFEVGTGYVEYCDVSSNMSYRTWRYCLQWLEENEGLYADYDMEGYPFDSTNARSVWVNHNGFEVIE
tara:strand:+ start:30 stop:344 length:315 start_codon:yes stop_codon:yes gene_type:complete